MIRSTWVAILHTLIYTSLNIHPLLSSSLSLLTESVPKRSFEGEELEVNQAALDIRFYSIVRYPRVIVDRPKQCIIMRIFIINAEY